MDAIIVILLMVDLLLAVIILLVLLKRKDPHAELGDELKALANSQETLQNIIREESTNQRAEQGRLNSELRIEINNSILSLSDSLKTENRNNREELNKAQNNLSESLTRRMQDLSNTLQTGFETLKSSLEARLEQIRTNNESKLEEMRRTVDEKLHETLEKRLGDSFKLVSERLEEVHKGLGEMKNLASGVGDLKRVLENVKTRGILGEVQLGNILEQLFTQEQYVINYKPKKRSDEVVEFALRLPGRDEDQEAIYLPIDSKFPIASYQRMVDAIEESDLVQVEQQRKALLNNIRNSARYIREKYINPPYTTDFALLFLPLEGLYAEVMRDYELFESIRRQHQVIVVGPSTMAAILNSLQIGFRTLAIEKRSSEVWKVLGAVKNEFGKFGTVLERTQKKLQEASNVIEQAQTRTRQIERKLNKVEGLPEGESETVLELEAMEGEE